MPPKSKVVDETPIPILGRFSTSLKIGIVGMPNVGKSSFFNLLTNSQAPAENYPFCTIDPHESRVAVPDERYDFLVNYFKPASAVPAFLNVVDIAGLVKGASEGEGLGNAFLSNIGACDAIFHLIRVFDDIEIVHVEGEVNPIKDLEVISNELILKDIEFANSRLDQVHKVLLRNSDKSATVEKETLEKVLGILNEKKWIRSHRSWSIKEIEVLNTHLFITAKPAIYLINLSSDDFIKKKNKWLGKIKQWVDVNDPGCLIIPFSATFEKKLSEMDQDSALAYCQEVKASSAFKKIIQSGFQTLQLHYFFTSGPDEVKAWTIQKGTRAPGAAGKIHTDFEKGFIMAEVMKFEDFKEQGSENAVKNAGKYKQEGKQYEVRDGDIIFFKFNAGSGLTTKKK